MKQLPAFTLVEVLVSLFLVALLGTFAVLALGNSTQDLRGMDGGSSQRLQVLFFCERLRADMDRATVITTTPDSGLVLDVEGGPVRYSLAGDSIVRSTAALREAFLAMPQGSQVVEEPSAAGLVKEWRMRLAVAGAPFVFRKEYDAATVAGYIVAHAHTP